MFHDRQQLTSILAGTSLRVAMFKRQKSLETQKFLGSISNSYDPVDSLNLQITGELMTSAPHSTSD